jgi:hypothetical protein
MTVVYFPIFFYWMWQALLSRSLFFFSASNPTIESGGMLGESKSQILGLVPDEVKPITLYFVRGTSQAEIITTISKKKLSYPIIAKPDMGERGWQVEKIEDETSLLSYIDQSPVDFIIQEYINLPIELGVFYYRMPDHECGTVSSIVLKEMLKVTGDGQSSLQELMMNLDRAKLQIASLEGERDLSVIPSDGEEVELVGIGNHCKGTTFLNANHLINEKLIKQFDQLSKRIDGFHYGRYDLRCASYEALNKGEMKIMELNGAGAEPAHIYQPGFSLFTAYGVLFKHWNILAKISRANHKKGIEYLTFSEAKEIWQRIQTKELV